MTPSRRSVLKGLCLSATALALRKARADRTHELPQQILSDGDMNKVLMLGRNLLASGLSAGSGYPEVWIRDLNTSIELALQVNEPALFRQALKNFMVLQGKDGDIVDGYVVEEKAQEPPYRTSPELPGYSAHKNTVESDQESSLVLATAKYVHHTGDSAFLELQIDGVPVRQRLGQALNFLLTERFHPATGLVWGGTTIDWGDVAPEQYPGTHLLPTTHRAAGVYHNALLTSALRDFLALPGTGAGEISRWRPTLLALKQNIRKHLWNQKTRKFIPHLYLDGSPFPSSFDESEIYLHGGTAVAIEADLLDRSEVMHALTRMRENVRAAGASSIGLTIYPPYPEGFYADPILTVPYTYQNGGDWSWFGGRMVQQLVRFGLVEDAWRELRPMTERVVRTGKFSEWYTRDDQPRGSSDFRGAAGVLGRAIQSLQEWAIHNGGVRQT